MNNYTEKNVTRESIKHTYDIDSSCPKRQCIYCGKENGLTESHIIPDALTNAKITNKTVCQVEHNNKFSDLFESKVISDFAFITNTLGIKSSKAKDYASYSAEINIDGNDYTVNKMFSNATLFQRSTLKAKDKTHIILKQSGSQISTSSHNYDKIDINNSLFKKTVKWPICNFTTSEIFRLMGKIAFEWYCMQNEINRYCEEFCDIISFITTGTAIDKTTGEDKIVVQVIVEETIYKKLYSFCNTPGSHLLLSFLDDDGRVNVVVSFFNMIMYRVIVSDYQMPCCHKDFMFQELRVDGTRRDFNRFETLKRLQDSYSEWLMNIGDLITDSTKQNGDVDLTRENLAIFDDIPFLVELINELKKPVKKVNFKTPEFARLILKNVEDNINRSYLNIKNLKRFVKEHALCDDGFKLNLNNSNPVESLYLYIVMRIGEKSSVSDFHFTDVSTIMLNEIVRDIIDHFENEDFAVDQTIENKIKIEFKKKGNLYDLFKIGATVIMGISRSGDRNVENFGK